MRKSGASVSRHGFAAAAGADTDSGGLGRDMQGWHSMRCSWVTVHCTLEDMSSMFAWRVPFEALAGGYAELLAGRHTLHVLALSSWTFACLFCSAMQSVAHGTLRKEGDMPRVCVQ